MGKFVPWYTVLCGYRITRYVVLYGYPIGVL